MGYPPLGWTRSTSMGAGPSLARAGLAVGAFWRLDSGVFTGQIGIKGLFHGHKCRANGGVSLFQVGLKKHLIHIPISGDLPGSFKPPFRFIDFGCAFSKGGYHVLDVGVEAFAKLDNNCLVIRVLCDVHKLQESIYVHSLQPSACLGTSLSLQVW